MQYELPLAVEPLCNAEKPLVIVPFNEREAAWNRFLQAREYNQTVHNVRRAAFGKGLATDAR